MCYYTLPLGIIASDKIEFRHMSYVPFIIISFLLHFFQVFLLLYLSRVCFDSFSIFYRLFFFHYCVYYYTKYIILSLNENSNKFRIFFKKKLEEKIFLCPQLFTRNFFLELFVCGTIYTVQFRVPIDKFV